MVIPGKNLHYAGIATGALVGVGLGATTMHFFGRTQDKVDRNSAAKREVVEFSKQREQLSAKVKAGKESGSMTIGELNELERQISELNAKIEARDFGSRTWSENWALSLGAAGGAGGISLAGKIDKGLGKFPPVHPDTELIKGNFRYRGVITNPGSSIGLGDARSDGVGFSAKWIEQGREKFTFAPGFVGGLAGGLVAGMVGMRMVQQYTNPPSSI